MGLFHRYHSTIHGNYRRAYLRGGLALGLLLALYVLVRLLMRTPMESPLSLLVDIILIVLIFLLTAWYRNSLPDKLITLKEAFLFGIGTAAVAAVVYGLLLWAICLASAPQTILFTNSMLGDGTAGPDTPQLHYWAAWWAIVAAVETLILGSFAAFLAAILFRNEKSEVRPRKDKHRSEN